MAANTSDPSRCLLSVGFGSTLTRALEFEAASPEIIVQHASEWMLATGRAGPGRVGLGRARSGWAWECE